MYAAEYIAQRLRGANSRRAEALRAFDRALAGNPAVFDTGDGVIQFGAEIAKSREAFLAGNPE